MASFCLLHPQVLLFNLVKQLLKKQIWKVKIYDIIKAFNAQIRQVNFCFWRRLFRMEVCWDLYHVSFSEVVHKWGQNHIFQMMQKTCHEKKDKYHMKQRKVFKSIVDMKFPL